MKRKSVVNKPDKILCGVCSNLISKYGFPSHILTHCSVERYVEKYGEFRPQKKPPTRKVNMVVCGICGQPYKTIGMFVHLRDAHSLTPDEYVSIHGEYRPKLLAQRKNGDSQ